MAMTNKIILAPISLGELIDKITILQIKSDYLKGTALVNVRNELLALDKILKSLGLQVNPELIQCLKEVNHKLWQIEDAIRYQEKNKRFDESFVNLARSVYRTNDRRAAIKKEINISYGSAFIEEKSYQNY